MMYRCSSLELNIGLTEQDFGADCPHALFHFRGMANE